MSDRIPKASEVHSTEELLLDPCVRALVQKAEASREDPEVMARLGAALNARLMHDKAHEACCAGLRRSPRHPDLWWEEIRATAWRGPEALGALEPGVRRLAEEHAGEAWPWRNLGLLCYSLEKDEPCREACERALAIQPSDSRTHEVLALRAYTLGDAERAVEHSIHAIECDPRNYRAHQWLGECYKEAGALEPAERCFLHALQIEENDFLSLESLGEMYLQKPETYPRAVQCFARILSVNPRNWTVYLRFVEWHLAHQRYVEAAAYCCQILALGPEAPVAADAHQYLGLIHFLQGDGLKAALEFQKVIEADPDFAPPYLYLGMLAAADKDEAKAAAFYHRAIEKDPEYAEPAVRLGYLHFDRKDLDEAERWFTRAREIDPETYEAHLGLAEVARARRNERSALAHAIRARDLAPGQSHVWNQVAISHDALGEVPAALEAYRRALDLDPRNRQAANNLGYLYERLWESDGRDETRQRAISAWRRRLLICRDTGASARAARSHLLKLGVGDGQIRQWLRTGRIEPGEDL